MTEEINEETARAKLELARKLMAMAEDPAATEAERAAFNDKAATVIAEYGIDRALLVNAGTVREEVGDRIIRIDNPYGNTKALLLGWAIATPLGVRNVRRIGKGENSVHLFGWTADLDRVEVLYTSLLVQAGFALAKTRAPSNVPTVTYRKSWWDGFMEEVQARLLAAEERAHKHAEKRTGVGMELVLVRRATEVDAAYKAAYPKTRTVRAGGYGSAAGHRAGAEAGREADLGGTRMGAGGGREIGA